MNTDKRLMNRPSGESLSPSVKNVTLEGNVNKQIRFLRLQEVVTLAQGIVS